MKKLILILVVLSSFAVACKKDDETAPKSPVPTSPSPGDTIKFFHRWQYTGSDSLTHSDSGCITQQHMQQIFLSINAFNINKGVVCN